MLFADLSFVLSEATIAKVVSYVELPEFTNHSQSVRPIWLLFHRNLDILFFQDVPLWRVSVRILDKRDRIELFVEARFEIFQRRFMFHVVLLRRRCQVVVWQCCSCYSWSGPLLVWWLTPRELWTWLEGCAWPWWRLRLLLASSRDWFGRLRGDC